MQVRAWSNGRPRHTGSGYGLRISARDRDRYFNPRWTTVVIDLEPSGHATVTLSHSFWTRCTELRSADIGRWLLARRLAPWPKGHPPHLELHHVHDNQFRLTDRIKSPQRLPMPGWPSW